MSAMVPVCRDCDGDGWVHVWSQDGENIVANIDCVVCGGTGVLDDDIYGVGVMCQMCGQWFPSPSDTFDTVPDHRRPDILAKGNVLCQQRWPQRKRGRDC